MKGWVAVVSTAYCLSGTMADGTGVRWGSVASNQYPLGTVLEIRPAVGRQRRWVVRDRIGWGTDLDFWVPSCGQALSWGRRTVRIRRWRRPRVVGFIRHRSFTYGAFHSPGHPSARTRDASIPAVR